MTPPAHPGPSAAATLPARTPDRAPARPRALAPVLVLALAVALLAGCTDDGAKTRLTIEHPDGTVVDMEVAFDAADTPTASRYAADGMPHPGNHTALDQLERAGVSYNATLTEFGYFVQSIDGIPPGENAFWKLVVNGEDATVGAGKLVLSVGDHVRWKVEGFTPAPADPLEVEITPAIRETTKRDVQVTVSTSRPALVHLKNGNTSVASTEVDGEATFKVPLEHGRNRLVATADDGGQTGTTDVIVVRLSDATVQIRFNDQLGREDRDDAFWYDIHTFPSAPMYDDVAMEHPGTATIHDVMVAWEAATGVPVDYRFSPSLGYSVTHIDGTGNPVDAAAPPWWCYTVNGEAPPLGISSQPFTPGDVILWDLGDCGFVPA